MEVAMVSLSPLGNYFFCQSCPFDFTEDFTILEGFVTFQNGKNFEIMKFLQNSKQSSHPALIFIVKKWLSKEGVQSISDLKFQGPIISCYICATSIAVSEHCSCVIGGRIESSVFTVATFVCSGLLQKKHEQLRLRSGYANCT